MKVKVSYERPGGVVDLLVSTDAAATVGDVAEFLTASDPTRAPSVVAPGTVRTLSIVGAKTITLDPQQPVSDSVLKSGDTVTVSSIGQSHKDSQQAVAAAVVTVLDGADKGKEFPLRAGSALIGRDPSCDVRLSDALVSRRHARINVSDVVEVVDLGSANATLIDSQAVPRSLLRPQDVVQLGDTRLVVRLLGASSEAAGHAAGGFVRSPRVRRTYEGRSFEAPEPPERGRANRFPLVSLIAPLLMGAVLYYVTKSARSLIFIGLSPLMLIGSNVEQRLGRKQEYKRLLAEFDEDVASLVDDLQGAQADEIRGRLQELPSVDECAEAMRQRNDLLWSRHPADAAFGQLRLGLGDAPSRNSVDYPRLKRSIRALHSRLREVTAPFLTATKVPVAGSLRDSAVGIAGPRPAALSLARSLLVQAAALHSPSELVIAVAASSTSGTDWDWVKWLPHTASAQSPVPGRLLCGSAGAVSALVDELEGLIDRRLASSDADVSPAMLVVGESDAPIAHSRLASLAERGPAVGVFVLWLAPDVTSLPAACGTFLEIQRDGQSATVGFVHQGHTVERVTLEPLDERTACTLSRGLSPTVDASAMSDDETDLARSVSFLDLHGKELATSADAVLERWTESRSLITGPRAPEQPPRRAGTLHAMIGTTGSDVFSLDLRADGPHALVGGTTGAGKSELLQSWILAMAATHSPQRLAFLLVDYKGGSAFRDCVDLPHTVGLVTDLSPSEVRRALTSLGAELRYREHLLHGHQAPDLVSMERAGRPEAPPSLVIVVDEFAALAQEVPEFVDGVVNVAQRGRSLGLHLILATQRPGGVIKENLRANTNLRLALRMADEANSHDVLGSPDAAFFDPDLPGRAISKTGPGRLVRFQTAYAGGRTADSQPKPEIFVEELLVTHATSWLLPETEEELETMDAQSGPNDLRRVVDRIREASHLAQISPPRKPWLPVLGPVYDLTDDDHIPTERRDSELVFGLRDEPEKQQQPTVAFHPDRDGNLVVYGTSGSGKSALLRTIAVAAGLTVRGGPCHVYGLDFGARGLSMLEAMPHVGSIIAGTDHERVSRLLTWLRGLIEERRVRYSSYNTTTISGYRESSGRDQEPRVILLLDGIQAFRDTYEATDRRVFETFARVLSDGRAVGVHVVLTAESRTAVTTSLLSSIPARVVLRMASAEDYAPLGVPADVLTETSPPGRGLVGDLQLQVAVLGGTADVAAQKTALTSFAAAMRRSGAAPAEEIRSLTHKIDLADLPSEISGRPVIGLRATTLDTATFDPSGVFLVTGPGGSGRTEAVKTVVAAYRGLDADAPIVWFGHRRSTLSQSPLWSTRVLVPDAKEACAELQTRIEGGERIAIVIENVADFAGSAAELSMVAMLKAAAAEDLLVIVEGETLTLGSPSSLLTQVKSCRAGLCLMPDAADGQNLYRTNFPRLNPADRIPGRGVLIQSGHAEIVQLGLSATG